MQNNTNVLRGITFTIVFEASSLNRDEKIGGNIPSIKKIMRCTADGREKTFSYFSRESMRHYLFHTLNTLYPDTWKLTPVSSGGKGKKVLRFDLSTASIIGFSELDAFGYMYTRSDVNSITRKAALSITKAVSLEPWNGDMQFNANHSLVQRKNMKLQEGEKEVTPNPVNKEEHHTFYKISFTIDIDKMGLDEWITDESPKYDKSKKILSLTISKKEKTVHKVTNCVYDGDDSYVVKDDNDDELGTIKVDKNHVIFNVSEREKKKRIKQIVSVVKNGLMCHVGGENWGIVPKFIIGAGLKLPIPLFQSYISLDGFDSSILENDYILSAEKPLIYIKDNIGLNSAHSESMEWNEFLNALKIEGDK